eukprot:12862-Rhodomonas_salina.1
MGCPGLTPAMLLQGVGPRVQRAALQDDPTDPGQSTRARNQTQIAAVAVRFVRAARAFVFDHVRWWCVHDVGVDAGGAERGVSTVDEREGERWRAERKSERWHTERKGEHRHADKRVSAGRWTRRP